MVGVPSGQQQSHVNGRNGPFSTREQTELTPKKMNTHHDRVSQASR